MDTRFRGYDKKFKMCSTNLLYLKLVKESECPSRSKGFCHSRVSGNLECWTQRESKTSEKDELIFFMRGDLIINFSNFLLSKLITSINEAVLCCFFRLKTDPLFRLKIDPPW